MWSCINVVFYLKTAGKETTVSFVAEFSFPDKKYMVKFCSRGIRNK